jgi:alkylhydroperoxidase/carboxymuconolactone decarboxylase family protein YurZ
MLTKRQQALYDSFYESTQNNEHLDYKTQVLVGLSAAMAMNCAPCTAYYLEQSREAGVVKGEIAEVLAKVMAVAAGQKRLQMKAVLEEFEISIDSFR